jgi:hypothetical protein
MAKQTKRGGTGRARKVGCAQRTRAGGGSELPPHLAIFAELLDPEPRETMRRRLIDGRGGAMERRITKFASRRPPAPEYGYVGWRFMTIEQYMQGEGNKPGPKYLNLPSGVVHPEFAQRRPKSLEDNLEARLHEAACALVQDPEYRHALQRRIDDGKAPAMQRLLRDIAEQHVRKPETWQPRLPFCFLSEHPPWMIDPLAERERIMIEARTAQDELEARAREAARTKQPTAAAARPDDPSAGEVPDLELYEES